MKDTERISRPKWMAGSRCEFYHNGEKVKGRLLAVDRNVGWIGVENISTYCTVHLNDLTPISSNFKSLMDEVVEWYHKHEKRFGVDMSELKTIIDRYEKGFLNG
jgi:hypothetical protein